MKKFLVLGLILAVAGGAFAQSITFSANVQSGIGVRVPGGGSPMVFGLQRGVFEGDRTHGQAELGVTIRNADGNASGHFGFRQGWGGNNTALEVYAANVRINLLDDMMTFVVGRGGPEGFATGAPFNPHFAVGGGNGFSIIARPIDGMTLGVSVHTGTGNGDGLGFSEFGTARYAIGVRYALPDVGAFVLTFRYNEGSTTAGNNRIDIGFGANLTSLVSGTSITRLAFDAQVLDITKKANAGAFIDIRFSEGLTFRFDDLTVGADLRQTLRMPTSGSMGMNLHFNIFGTYAVNETLTPGINVGFVLGGGLDAAYRRPANALAQGATAGTGLGDAMAVALNPYLTLNLGSSITFEVGYTFATTLKGASTTRQAIYINTNLSY